MDNHDASLEQLQERHERLEEEIRGLRGELGAIKKEIARRALPWPLGTVVSGRLYPKGRQATHVVTGAKPGYSAEEPDILTRNVLKNGRLGAPNRIAWYDLRKFKPTGETRDLPEESP